MSLTTQCSICPKYFCCHLLTQIHMMHFIWCNTKGDVLKNVHPALFHTLSGWGPKYDNKTSKEES